MKDYHSFWTIKNTVIVVAIFLVSIAIKESLSKAPTTRQLFKYRHNLTFSRKKASPKKRNSVLPKDMRRYKTPANVIGTRKELVYKKASSGALI